MSENPKFKYMHLNRELDFWESLYLPEILRGMSVSLGHFMSNWPFFRREKTVTKEYPEEKFDTYYRTRGRHYLTRRSDGSITCVACQMCAMACPANVITIEAEEIEPYYTGRQKIDRRPKTFVIDQLTCIYCGFCVQACPEDAIRMDSGHPALAIHSREEAIVGRDLLLDMKNTKEGQHNIVFNPIPGKEPAQAPFTVLPTEDAQRREY